MSILKPKRLKRHRLPSTPTSPILPGSTTKWYHLDMQRKHRATLKQLFARPVSGTIRWSDVEALFVALGAEISERAGSRVAVDLFGEIQVFHRPHPSPETDKGAVNSIRKWLEANGVKP